MNGKVVFGMLLVGLMGFSAGIMTVRGLSGPEKDENGLTLEERVVALEKKDKTHEAALTGAATRLEQITQAHNGWVQQARQSEVLTQGALTLIDQSLAKKFGADEWKAAVEEAKAALTAKPEPKAEVKEPEKKE